MVKQISNKEQFFINPKLPYAELRHSHKSQRVFKSHMHTRFSIGAVDCEDVVFTVLGQKNVLRTGSLALINPNVIHSCNAGSTASRSYYMLYLDIGYCLKIQQSIWQTKELIRVENPLLSNESLYKKFIETMTLLIATETHLLEKEQRLAELITTIFLASCHHNSKAAISTQPSHLEKIRHYLSNNLQEDITLTEYAEKLNKSPYTLLRQFKENFGITPHTYRTNCRIEAARKLLQQGKDISDTALECGFFDQSHFHKCFKAITTVTPREYQVNFLQ